MPDILASLFAKAQKLESDSSGSGGMKALDLWRSMAVNLDEISANTAGIDVNTRTTAGVSSAADGGAVPPRVKNAGEKGVLRKTGTPPLHKNQKKAAQEESGHGRMKNPPDRGKKRAQKPQKRPLQRRLTLWLAPLLIPLKGPVLSSRERRSPEEPQTLPPLKRPEQMLPAARPEGWKNVPPQQPERLAKVQGTPQSAGRNRPEKPPQLNRNAAGIHQAALSPVTPLNAPQATQGQSAKGRA